MNKADKLVKAIKDHIDYLGVVDINKMDDFHFLEDFLKIYNVNDVESFDNITNTSYLMSILMAEGIKIPFDDLLNTMDNIKEFVDDVEFDNATYIEYLYLLEKLNNLGIIDKIKKTSEIMNFNEEEMKIYNNYKKISEELFKFKNDKEENIYHPEIDENFIKLFKILPDPEIYQSFIDLRIASSMMNKSFDDVFNGVVNSISADEYKVDKKTIDKILAKKSKKIKSKGLQKFFQKGVGKKVREDYDKLASYCYSLEKQVKDEVLSINKRMKKLENFIYKLLYVSNEDIIKINDYDDYLFDPNIKSLFIEFCLEHNLNTYKKIEEKNREYKNNNLNKLEVLFIKYGFNFNDLFVEEQNAVIKANKEKNIEEILALIKYSDLAFLAEYHKEFTKLIINVDAEVIKAIDCALKSKIIDKNFIINNLDVLYDEDKYKNLSKNINLLTIRGVNLVNITKKNSQLLVVDNNLLTVIFEALDEYNFTLGEDNNYDILVNSDLLDIIDNFIELGLYQLLKENQKYLNKDSNNIIKRIIISNLIGINYINGNNKLVGQIASGNKFYVGPEKYNNYIVNEGECYLNPTCVEYLENHNRLIISEETKCSEAIMRLDELYQKNKQVYEIDGVTISRNRVLRNFEILKQIDGIEMTDVLYQSIIYKMTPDVSDEKFVEIYNTLKMLNLENNKTYKKQTTF